MAETTPKAGPERPQGSEKSGKRATVKGGKAPAGKGLVWMAIVISLASLGAGGYALLHSTVTVRVQSAEHTSRVNILERRLGVISAAQQKFRSEVGQIKGQLGGSEGAIAGWVGDLRDEIREQQVVAAVREEELRRDIRVLSDSMVKLRSEFGSSVDHWRLQEVEQLMVIANQRLQLSADTEMAGKALKLADNQLRRLADPAFRPVRAILADEIAALGKVSTVDVAGTLNALSALARGVDDLPLIGAIQDGGIDPGASASLLAGEAGDVSSWWGTGKGLLADLGALVQVETDGKLPGVILSPELRRVVYEKTKLILESSQLAFLREQREVYAARIEEAKDWVSANFDTDSERVRQWLEQLAVLAVIAPQTELPDISASLAALREVTGAGAQ